MRIDAYWQELQTFPTNSFLSGRRKEYFTESDYRDALHTLSDLYRRCGLPYLNKDQIEKVKIRDGYYSVELTNDVLILSVRFHEYREVLAASLIHEYAHLIQFLGHKHDKFSEEAVATFTEYRLSQENPFEFSIQSSRYLRNIRIVRYIWSWHGENTGLHLDYDLAREVLQNRCGAIAEDIEHEMELITTRPLEARSYLDDEPKIKSLVSEYGLKALFTS